MTMEDGRPVVVIVRVWSEGKNETIDFSGSDAERDSWRRGGKVHDSAGYVAMEVAVGF